LAASSKIPALDTAPKTRHNSLKNFPAQLNHCSFKSSVLTQMCLYAAAQSVFAIQQPLPAAFSTCSHAAVEDIFAGNSSLFIPSFTLLPFGADKFRITLTEPLGFGLTMIPLTFASAGTWSAATGPNA
jgi:hypothetical protein